MKPDYLWTLQLHKQVNLSYCLNCSNRVLLAATKHILTNSVHAPTELMPDQEGRQRSEVNPISPVSRMKIVQGDQEFGWGEGACISAVPSGISTILTSLGLDFFQTCF